MKYTEIKHITKVPIITEIGLTITIVSVIFISII